MSENVEPVPPTISSPSAAPEPPSEGTPLAASISPAAPPAHVVHPAGPTDIVLPTPPKPAAPSNPLAKFPSKIKAKHKLFLETGNLEALDEVVLAVILDHQPSIARKTTEGEIPDEARLIEDLGFDSLALAEIVFFFEDLYKVTISNEELKAITTMGEIRAFVRTKVASSTPQ